MSHLLSEFKRPHGGDEALPAGFALAALAAIGALMFTDAPPDPGRAGPDYVGGGADDAGADGCAALTEEGDGWDAAFPAASDCEGARIFAIGLVMCAAATTATISAIIRRDRLGSRLGRHCFQAK